MHSAVSPACISGPLSDAAGSSGVSLLSGRPELGSWMRAAASSVSGPLSWSASANRALAATESGVAVRCVATGCQMLLEKTQDPSREVRRTTDVLATIRGQQGGHLCDTPETPSSYRGLGCTTVRRHCRVIRRTAVAGSLASSQAITARDWFPSRRPRVRERRLRVRCCRRRRSPRANGSLQDAQEFANGGCGFAVVVAGAGPSGGVGVVGVVLDCGRRATIEQ